ncbi:Superoxide dismutase [Cu-Zn] [Thelohanellus kitauei]|uniref:Superoxide dismutase [Cu-Zn] n=1 Tax=Thelohanellus kitauei TaxID=669202 RepID=A0A0C2ML56_THEKT|nr:Superoxide dismutase [Cu-Zn] [Thelohanellus kitauei]
MTNGFLSCYLGCTSAGPHYNPLGQSHGGVDSAVRHLGDFGNIQVDSKGESKVCVTLPKGLSLFGEHSPIGRSLVIHERVDDLGLGKDEESKKTGSSGPRIACAVVGIADASTCECPPMDQCCSKKVECCQKQPPACASAKCCQK